MARANNPKRILTKKRPEKRLQINLKRKAGKGAGGRISVRHKGSGAKRLYRLVDFGEEKMDMQAKVIALEYDPYRTSFICLLEYQDGEKRYRIAPNNINIEDTVICSDTAEIKTGNRLRLKNIPVGTEVYNIELEPGRGGKIVRGAGTAARVASHEGRYSNIVLPSSEVRKISSDSFASIGQVSFPEHKFIKDKKAGDSRHKGKRPTVRGSAMVPADHPHGGGEGRAPIGLTGPKTPWGKPARGVKTRKKKWTDKLIINRRKKKK